MRNFKLDLLKLTLALMVVGLHAGFLRDINAVGYHLTVQGLFRIAVPIFYIINGYYFVSALENKHILNWFKRVFYLYAFWMLVYCFFWVSTQDLTFRTAAVMIQQVLFGYYHLWYLSGLLGAAALLVLLKKRSLRLLVATAITMFLIGLSLQYLGNYHQFVTPVFKKIGLMTWLYRNFAFFAFPFFCIGYILRKYCFESRVSRKWLYAWISGGTFLLLAESYLNFCFLGSFILDISASLLIICPALFLYVVSDPIKGKHKRIGSFANGIYFVHPLFLHMLSKVTDLGTVNTTIVTILISLPTVYILEAVSRRFRFIL